MNNALALLEGIKSQKSTVVKSPQWAANPLHFHYACLPESGPSTVSGFTPTRRENSGVNFAGRMTADDFLVRATTAIENRFLLPHLVESSQRHIPSHRQFHPL